MIFKKNVATINGMENKRGRPALSDEQRKGYMFRLRMTQEERSLLDKAARQEGKDTSAWARATLVSRAKKMLATGAD